MTSMTRISSPFATFEPFVAVTRRIVPGTGALTSCPPAGAAAAAYVPQARKTVPIHIAETLLYLVPQQLDLARNNQATTLYFRARNDYNNSRLVMTVDGKEAYTRKYAFLRPPEMEKLTLDFDALGLTEQSDIRVTLELPKEQEG